MAHSLLVHSLFFIPTSTLLLDLISIFTFSFMCSRSGILQALVRSSKETTNYILYINLKLNSLVILD